MVVIVSPSCMTGKGQAADDAHAIRQHRAGAALALVATLLGSGEAKVFAKRVQQGRAGVDRKAAHLAVYRHLDLVHHGHLHGLRASRWNQRLRTP